MYQKENIESENLLISTNIIDSNFSFGKPSQFNNNSNLQINKITLEKKINKFYHQVNDKENDKKRKKEGILIFKLLNKNNFSSKEKSFPILITDNNCNQGDQPTKPKFTTNNKIDSPEKPIKNYNYYPIIIKKKKLPNINKIKINSLNNFEKKEICHEEEKIELIKLFNIKEEEKLPFEIKYFLNSPKFNFDFQHQNDNNSNFQYINENFLDILLNSYNKKMILRQNINPLKEIQKDINFTKRNILISWLTEINFKYIKNQNVLFTAVKYIDRILYNKNININEFQLFGIVCFNLALKMEWHYKVFYIDEIIALIGGPGDNNGPEKKELTKKIKKMENKICDYLDFDLEVSTSVMILQRLIQILNISNKKTEELLCSIAYFFLEVSLYDEQFYELDEFIKAFSSLIMAKQVLIKYYYKIGIHSYIKECAKLRINEIKYYYSLCGKVIKKLKSYKYGITIFYKYQHKDFYHIITNYLNPFIIQFLQDNSNFDM